MTSFSRSGIIWAVWFATVALTAAILAWVSFRAMKSERDEQQLAVRAENERLALWRMESRLLPILSRESAWNSSSGILGPGTMHVQSGIGIPGLLRETGFRWEEEQEFVSCRFHIDPTGQIWHPGPHKWFAIGQSREELTPAERAFDTRIAAISREELFGQFDRVNRTEAPKAISTGAVPFSLTQLPSPMQTADPMMQQLQRNQSEFNSRTLATNTANFQLNALNYPGSDVVLPATAAAEAPLISYWQEGQLLLARQVEFPVGFHAVHGCVLDWDAIRTALCHDVRDLLPNAQLVPLDDDEVADNYALASIPVRLIPGEPDPVATPYWSSMRVSLLLAWMGFAICAAAVGILLLGLMRLSQRRADFVSAVSHELRTPLTTFQIYTDLLSDSDSLTEDKRQRYLATLKREATRLTSLVDNVLGFARLETTAHATQVETLHWSTFCESIHDALAERAAQAGMRIEVLPDESSDGRFRANASALERIIFNLVDNACKYAAESDPPVIAISTAISASGFEVRVRDHGPGLSASAHQRLFKPFSKSATEAARTSYGVGLGLSLSRQLARGMRGELSLEQSNAKGTTFLLRLPAA